MELEVQKFLRWHRDVESGLAALESKFAIHYKQHSIYPELYSLKYDQLESINSEPIVQECRGLILNSANNWNIVAFPFKRFFNLGQIEAANIDWETAKVQEKRDGSLLILYYYKEWQVATSGCPDGLNQINDTGLTFKDLFWQTFNKQLYGTNWLNKNHTYMFELTSPFNRVVVDYKESELTLIGARDNKTLKEYDTRNVNLQPDVLTFVPVLELRPKEYALNSVEACIDAANHLNPLRYEGYVVVDANFNRIKIKSPNYIILHHLRETCSLKHMANIIRQGESEELKIALDSYPELKIEFDKLLNKYNSIIENCFMLYDSFKHIKDQKEFANKALQTPYSSVLFAMRKSNKTVQDIIKNLTTNAYLKMMEIR